MFWWWHRTRDITRVYGALRTPGYIVEIVAATGIPSQKVEFALSRLEWGGWICGQEIVPGGQRRYERKYGLLSAVPLERL